MSAAMLARPAPVAAAPRCAIIIPARYQSQRFPGKPLATLRGVGGHAIPLIERSWQAAQAAVAALTATGAARGAQVWIATDDPRIAQAVGRFGGQVVMTSPTCRNGTERCAQAVARLGLDTDIVINVQGDAPLTPAAIVPDLVAALAAAPDAAMATAALRCSPGIYAHLAADAAAGRVGGTTVVTNRAGHALYFSKRLLPFISPGAAIDPHAAVRLHLGLYAYRPQALAQYARTAPSSLEALEGLEQLRFLEGDAPVLVLTRDSPGWDCIELNNPEDVPVIEAILAQRGID